MIKRFLSVAVVILGSFLMSQSALAQSAFDWEMNSFHSDIVINQDATIHVTETIEAEFFTEKRGIFRDIPIRYYDEKRQADSIYINVLSVKDKNGNPWEYLVTNEFSYINIRIGNPEIYLTGEETYIIEYTVKGALGFFGDHDELYWDVTGNDWFVPIHKTSATITLPSGATENIGVRCFTGVYGSTDEDCTGLHAGSLVDFNADDFLTIVVGWPKGLVDEPSQVEKTASFLKDNWAYTWPGITFLLMLLAWRKWGKDPEDPPGLVTQFEPPFDLTPAEVAYLVNQKITRADLPAELVNLASKGFIHIKEKMSKKAKKPDDYILIKKKDFDDPALKEHERLILKGIFLSKEERKVSNIPSSFYSKVPRVKKQILKQLKSHNFFRKDPGVVRNQWVAISVLMFFMLPFTFAGNTVQYFIGVLFSAIIVLIFAFIMPRRTKDGVLALEHALGFRQYIEIAEDRRVKWEEEQNLFFQYLPYAMVFGLAKKWAKAFDDVFKELPDWYEGDLSNFNALSFHRSLNLFSATTKSNITPPPSSGGGGSYSRSSSSSFSSSSSGFSGGGSSGGGGGGGGGGSW
jgi:uncharacterized membrane protein YgcG